MNSLKVLDRMRTMHMAPPAPPAVVPAPLAADGGGDGAVVFEEPDAVGPVAVPPPVLPHIPVPAPIAAVHALMPALPPAEAPIDFNIAGMTDCRVNFDNLSHQSGTSRAFLYCKYHGYRCRLYIFLKDHPTKERACSYLFAWHALGEDLEIFAPHTTLTASHIASKPPPELIEAVHQMRFG